MRLAPPRSPAGVTRPHLVAASGVAHFVREVTAVDRPSDAVLAGRVSWAATSLGGIPALFAVRSGRPAAGLLLLIVLAVTPLTIVRPRAALLLLVVGELSNASAVLGKHSGISLYYASLAIGVAALGLQIRGRRRLPWSPVYLWAGAFVAAGGLSAFVATDPGASYAVLTESVKDLLFLVVVLGLIAITSYVRRVIEAAVVVLSALAALTLVQQFVLHNSTTVFGFTRLLPADVGSTVLRHTGPDVDANYWARTLVLAVPLALSLWADRRYGGRRWAWLGCAGVLAGGIGLTGSRGGLIALLVVVILWFLLVGPPERWALLILPPLAVLALSAPGVGSRLATLSQLNAASSQAGDASLVGRVEALRTGLAMFADHPALGVGVGNFRTAAPAYQRKLGFSVTRSLGPHNLYLGMAAEGGLVGIAAWALVAGGPAWITARRVWRRASSRLLDTGLLVAIFGFAAASVFLQLEHFRHVLLIGALVGAQDLSTAHRRRPVTLRRTRLSGPGAIIAAGCATSAVLLALVVPVRPGVWTAGTRGVLQPDAQSGSTAYSYDVLTRSHLLLTFAAVVNSAGPAFRREFGGAARGLQIAVHPTPVDGVITVTATGPTRAITEAAAATTFDQGVIRIANLGTSFRLVTVASTKSVGPRIGLPDSRPVVSAHRAKVWSGPWASFLIAVWMGLIVLARRNRLRTTVWLTSNQVASLRRVGGLWTRGPIVRTTGASDPDRRHPTPALLPSDRLKIALLVIAAAIAIAVVAYVVATTGNNTDAGAALNATFALRYVLRFAG